MLEVNSDFRIQVIYSKLIFSKLKVKKIVWGSNIFFNENLSFISKVNVMLKLMDYQNYQLFLLNILSF